MKKNIGKLIEDRVKSQNLNVTEFAKAIEKDRSTAYDIFSRDSIDTKLLEKIGQILKYDFFQDLLQPETKQEIVLRNAITNKIYIEIDLSEDEANKIGLQDKVIGKFKKKNVWE